MKGPAAQRSPDRERSTGPKLRRADTRNAVSRSHAALLSPAADGEGEEEAEGDEGEREREKERKEEGIRHSLTGGTPRHGRHDGSLQISGRLSLQTPRQTICVVIPTAPETDRRLCSARKREREREREGGREREVEMDRRHR